MSNTNTAATQPRYIQNTIQNTEATENNKNRNTATNNTQATEVQTEQEQIPNTTSTTSINNRHPMHLQKPWGHDHAVKTLGSIHNNNNSEIIQTINTSLKVIANFFDVSNLMEDDVVSGATDSDEK